MRVLIISPFMHRLRRGIERFTVDLASELATNGDEAHILAWRDPNNFRWESAHPAIRWHQVPLTRYYQRLCAGLLYPLYIGRIQPDVIILSFMWHGEEIALRLFRPKAQINLVLNYPAAQVKSRYEYVLDKQLIRLLDNVVAVSQFVADGARPYLGEVSAVIPNGVYTDRFRPVVDKGPARRSLNLLDDRPVIVTIAALEKRKGLQHMVSAMPHVLSELPHALYIIAGEGSYRSELQKQIDALNLTEHVHLTGNVADPRPVYNSADLFAFLTTGEACPIALLEAMASGLPLLLAKKPPLDEFANESGAMFVATDNPIEIADRVVYLLTHDEICDAMGKYNRQRAVDKFDWSKVIGDFHKLWRTPTL